MPFMLVGIGPLGSGMLRALASSALSRLSMSVISAGLSLAPSFVTCRTSLGSGTWPSPLPHDDLVDRGLGGDPLVLAALGGQQLLQPVGVALADQHDAGRADHAVHDVLLLGEGDRRVGLPAAAQHAAGAAAAAPGWPSIWLYAAFWARRPKTISAGEQAEQQRRRRSPDDSRARRRAGSQNSAKPTARADEEAPAGSTGRSAGRTSWSSGRSATICWRRLIFVGSVLVLRWVWPSRAVRSGQTVGSGAAPGAASIA